MKNNYHQLLKPELLNTVSGLALTARIIVKGHLPGFNVSKSASSGMAFSQYKTYEPGDDIRLLDWKMLARSNRHYIKQTEIETNLTIKFILDASQSMSHTEDDISKIDYARILIASLAYLSQNQGDAIGLFALNEHQLYSIYPKVEKQHYNRFLQELLLIETQGKWPEESNITKQFHSRNGKELLFFITDLYEDSSELIDFIKRLKTNKNEVVVLHLIGKNELEFNYNGQVTFEDLETNVKLKVDAKKAKKEYLNSLELHLKTKKDKLLANTINYQQFIMGTPMAETIRFFLKKRNKLQ